MKDNIKALFIYIASLSIIMIGVAAYSYNEALKEDTYNEYY
nr:MAG TPA: hypothetical protein [Caudoviricetes sp.]